MEVHSHTKTPRQKWTHYFWEFFMLFLAVTLGFFMENQREHHVEHKRTKVLAKSLYEDIKRDTAALRAAMNFSKEKNDSIDAVARMLHLPREHWNDTLIYSNLTFATRVNPFEWTEGTYDQLKSSGSLRYFDQTLVNLLNAYAVQAKKTLAREDIDVKYTLDQYFPFLIRFVNIEATIAIRFGTPVTSELYFTRTDLATIRELINLVVIIKTIRLRTMIEYEALSKSAIVVLAELKKEFKL